MAKSITLHLAPLSVWFSRFAANGQSNEIERGIDLYRNSHVWDYHASRTGIHASVEDRQLAFYQVNVTWLNEWNQAVDPERFLPDPLVNLTMRCTCTSVNMPCEHVAAAVIYWISELDRKNREQPSMILPDADKRDYDRKLAFFRKLSKEKTASFADFDADSLHLRPDLQKEISRISTRVMRQIRDWVK